MTNRFISLTDIKGHHVGASVENTEYSVVTDESGKEAAHKASTLKKTAKKN